MKCPYCGTVNEPGKTYCKNCGRALPKPKPITQQKKQPSFRLRLAIAIAAIIIITVAWIVSYQVHR